MKIQSLVFTVSILSVLLTSCSTTPLNIPGPPSNWQTGYVIANNIRIYYLRTGGNKPTMVLAHGSSDNGMCWTNFAKEFESKYDIIMYDARGHGLSDPPAANDPIDIQAEDLAALIKSLGLTKPIVMGHSMGSSSTAWFAAKYPNIAKAIILEDPRLAPRPTSSAKRYEPANIQKRRLSILKKNNSTYEDIYTRGLQNTPQWGESELRYWAPSKLLHHPNSAFRKIGKHPKMSEIFPQITVPTLILKADDQGSTRKTNFQVSKLLLNGKIVHIKGAGHNVRRDQKKLTIEAVKNFLENLK